MNNTVKLFPRLHQPHKARGQLEAEFAARGFEPGRPTQLDDVAFYIDQKTVRCMVCPGCQCKGLSASPYHCGQRYRILAACPFCDAAEEV